MISFIIFALALFVDGATDSANSVTGAVLSKSLSQKSALFLCAALSFFGCLIFCSLIPGVSESLEKAVTFPPHLSSYCIIVSLLTVSVWSGAALVISVPTSEGHALLAASAGAAFALGGEVNFSQLFRIFIFILPAIAVGVVLSTVFLKLFSKVKREHTMKIPIILSAALSSFFHGAQDGQKFLALALSASLFPRDKRILFVFISATIMGIGALFGGRIIRKMGEEITYTDKKSALCADLGSSAALALLTFFGIPASTTHVKMTSLFACARLNGQKGDNSSFALMFFTWIATFPVCFLLAFLLSKAFFLIFL